MYHDLADALVAHDVDLDVIAIDWRKVDQSNGYATSGSSTKYRLFRYQPLELALPGAVSLGLKWIASSLICVPRLIGLLIQNKYSVVVAQTPAALWAPLFICRLFSNAKLYLVQWDFTPYHQRAIGMMGSGPAFNFLLFLENMAIKNFDIIGCMSPKNIDYLKAHYKISSRQKVELLPIWAAPGFPPAVPRDEIRRIHDLPVHAKLAVFGGTLSKGRGIEDIVLAATKAAGRYPDLHFLIVGSGPLENEVREMAAGLDNLAVRRGLPREDYLALLKAADAGIVATERGTGVPTFPSKTMDYFRAGVPVVASVEDSTDFGEFLMAEKAGRAVKAGDPEELLAQIVNITSDKKASEALVGNGRRLLDTYFGVDKIACQILSIAS